MIIKTFFEIDPRSGIEEIAYKLRDNKFESFTLNENYGPSIEEICILLVSRNPEIPLKQRIRMDRKKNILYMDIMFYLPDMISSTRLEREKKIIEAILDQIPKAIRKYKFKTFDIDRFENDMKDFFSKWIYSEK